MGNSSTHGATVHNQQAHAVCLGLAWGPWVRCIPMLRRGSAGPRLTGCCFVSTLEPVCGRMLLSLLLFLLPRERQAKCACVR